MFHRYVEHEGQKIDYDRASWLMDKETFQNALKTLDSTLGRTPFDLATAERMGCKIKPVSVQDELQALWDSYCVFHERKFGRRFNPDVM